MYYSSADAPAGTSLQSMVDEIRKQIGTIQTLDESPPVFTELSIVDPTVGSSEADPWVNGQLDVHSLVAKPMYWRWHVLEAAEGSIVVSFALNEPGTAYCRPTRQNGCQC